MEKRSLSLHGHRTSLALEPEFWIEIDKAVDKSGLSFAAFITQLDDQRILNRAQQNLASYLRVWVLKMDKTDERPLANKPFRKP